MSTITSQQCNVHYCRSASTTSLMILQPHTTSPTMTPPPVAIVAQLPSQLRVLLMNAECAAMCLKSLHLPALTLPTSM